MHEHDKRTGAPFISTLHLHHPLKQKSSSRREQLVNEHTSLSTQCHPTNSSPGVNELSKLIYSGRANWHTSQHRTRNITRSVALAGVFGAEEAVADGVEPLHTAAARDELLELERQPLVPGRVEGHGAGAHRRPRHVHLALLARERRHLQRRLDQEVAAPARHAPERLLPAAVPAPQEHLRACTCQCNKGSFFSHAHRSHHVFV
jgi:hypothetical protein